MCSSCSGNYEDPDRTADRSKLYDANLTPKERESRRGLELASPSYSAWLASERAKDEEMAKELGPIRAQQVLTNAIRHLEAHHPEAVGMHASKPWYVVDYADYSAAHILSALRELVIRT